MRRLNPSRRPLFLIILLATALTAWALPAASAQHLSRADATTPCGTLTATGDSSQVISHVVWVVFENKTINNFDGPNGAAASPYLHGLAGGCGYSQAYSATPNNASKLAMTSGTDWGVYTDAAPVPGPDIYSQLGTSWHEYQGGMDTNCQTGFTATYSQRHNPATYFADALDSCATQDTPLPDDPAQIDISAPFTWVEGNLDQSMHSCPVGCGVDAVAQLADGDAWAATVIPALIATPQYQSGDTAIFVVWDQGNGINPITPFIVVSPYAVPATVSTTPLTHYSLLRGTEEYLGLPLLGHAADDTTTSVAGLFGLPPAVAPTPTPRPTSVIIPPVIAPPPPGAPAAPDTAATAAAAAVRAP